MSNSEIHIRDLLEGNLEDISVSAMCGDRGQGLTFGIPAGSTCTRCKERWYEEKSKDPIRHKFRLKMHGVLNGGYSLD